MSAGKAFIVNILLVLTLLFVSCNTPESPGEKNSGEERRVVQEQSDASEDQVESAEDAAGVLDSFYSESSDSAEALAALETAGIDSMDPDSRLIYAVLLRDQGRFDESRDELETLVADDPGNADAWFNLALLEHAAGNDKARDKALGSAISADGSMADAYAFRGNLAVADSDWDKAEVNLKKALELKPDSVESLTGLAWVMAKTERLEHALMLLDNAVEIDSEFVYARVDRSRVNVALRNYNDAENDLSFVIKKEPDVPWHYLDRARIRLRYFKEYESALEDLNNVERLDPDNFFALVYLAGLHNDLRHFVLAKDYYQRVVDLRSDYIWAYRPLGKFAWMERDFDAASRWFLKAAAEDPEDFSFPLMAGLSMLYAGKVSEADKQFSETLRMFHPGDSAYEVIRFCAERNSDYYAVNALNKEPDETLGERLWFYLGAIYEFEKNNIGATAVYLRIADRKGEMEYDLAWAALNGMEN
ncbi:MAG: tetratricopeptide repeat protein [Spirochaetaceae bacterium]|nr:tetratricopeptide repeat protein [Spirochaetaceae bacterium]